MLLLIEERIKRGFDFRSILGEFHSPQSWKWTRMFRKISNNKIITRVYLQAWQCSEQGDLSWCGRFDRSPATRPRRPVHGVKSNCPSPLTWTRPPGRQVKATVYNHRRIIWEFVIFKFQGLSDELDCCTGDYIFTQRQSMAVKVALPNFWLLAISLTLHMSTWLAKATAFSKIFHDDVLCSSLFKLWWILTIQPAPSVISFF